MARRKKRNDSSSKSPIAARVAIAVASGLALAAVTVTCIAALYTKSLTDICYIGDEDEYTED